RRKGDDLAPAAGRERAIIPLFRPGSSILFRPRRRFFERSATAARTADGSPAKDPVPRPPQREREPWEGELSIAAGAATEAGARAPAPSSERRRVLRPTRRPPWKRIQTYLTIEPRGACRDRTSGAPGGSSGPSPASRRRR